MLVCNHFSVCKNLLFLCIFSLIVLMRNLLKVIRSNSYKWVFNLFWQNKSGFFTFIWKTWLFVLHPLNWLSSHWCGTILRISILRRKPQLHHHLYVLVMTIILFYIKFNQQLYQFDILYNLSNFSFYFTFGDLQL